MPTKTNQERPRLIRGCMFDAHWEFDAPTIIYEPFFKFGYGGNSGHLDSMVEGVCIDTSIGRPPNWDAMKEELLRECEWRGWSLSGFRRRKEAWHVEFYIRWFEDEDGELNFEVLERRERFGPFAK